MTAAKTTKASAKPRTRKATTKPKTAAKPASTPDLEAGKAVAEQNAEELRQEPTVEEKREERAEIIETLNEREAERVEKVQKEAREAGLHEAKIDDAGAAEQQRVARESDVKEQTRLGELTGAPVTAPVVEQDNPGSIEIVSRRDPSGASADTDDSFRFVGHNLAIVGEGFLAPGEVIIDIRRKDGQDHQRFSTWTDDGRIDVVLPGINGIGDWRLHCEQVVTQVGEGRDDHQQLIRETDEVEFELY